MSPTQTPPAPKAVLPQNLPLTAKSKVEEFLLSEAGATIPPDAREQLLAVAQEEKRDQIMLANSYFVVCLHAAALNREVRGLQCSAVKHVHGNTPRVLLFEDAFLALTKLCKSEFLAPALSEGDRINREIQALMNGKKDTASKTAALRRVAVDLKRAFETRQDAEVLKAAEAVRDLALTELDALPEQGAVYPSADELNAAYYPIENEGHLWQAGDAIFDVETKTVVYQHGNPRETQPPPEIPVNAVIMRPFGVAGVTSLRLRLAAFEFRSVAQSARTKDAKKSRGYVQGLEFAQHVMTRPTWEALPIRPYKSNQTSVGG